MLGQPITSMWFGGQGSAPATSLRGLHHAGIHANVHYIPVYRQPYFRNKGFRCSAFPEAERYYAEALTLPIYPALTEGDQSRCCPRCKAHSHEDRSGYGSVRSGLWNLESGGRTPDDEVVAILEMAKRCGISVLDTAPLYGNSEEVVGGRLPAPRLFGL